MELGSEVLPGTKTYEEFCKIRDCLTQRQMGWLNDKCQWEHMIPWAVMQEFGVPAHNSLPDGEEEA